MGKLVEILSGEFFLNRRPNGGTAVLYRSLWVTGLACLLVLPAKSYFTAGTTLSFSASQLKIEIGEMIPWAGAIFAGAYVALYSRFAAQWNYLASLYNHLMATCVALPQEQRHGNKALANWRAAFVEDALDLQALSAVRRLGAAAGTGAGQAVVGLGHGVELSLVVWCSMCCAVWCGGLGKSRDQVLGLMSTGCC
jgi:hypothetical protein